MTGQARGRRPSKPALLVVGILLGGMSAGGVAAAATVAAKPSHACVGNKTGAVRLAHSCTKAEHALVLGAAGARGPQGPAGAVGPVGPTGAAGQSGPAGTGNFAVRGTVPADGGGVAGSAAGTVSWSHLGTGRYCLGDSAVGAGDVAHPVITPVSPSSTGIETPHSLSAVVLLNPSCGAYSVEVDLLDFDSVSGTYQPVDLPFNYLMVSR